MAASSVNFGNLYEQVGGDQWFIDLVDRFYTGVESDGLLRPMYPKDLTNAKDHTAKFLIQFWGGPDTYSQERGHPRLRMRHMPFVIGKAERDRWVFHMENAVKSGGLDETLETQMLDYFERAATHMINS